MSCANQCASPAKQRCQKALNEFLENKRSIFPRFYFIGDDDLLEIVAKLVATAVDPNELNAVATDLQHLPGVRHATWEVSTTE